MRYQGQAFELPVPWGDVSPDLRQLERLLERFHHMHRQRFSYANPNDVVEVVTLRGSAIGRMPRHESVRAARKGAGVAERRPVFISGGWRDAEVHRAAGLATEIHGPAIIEDEYTTVYLAEGWRCAPGDRGALVAVREVGKGSGE